MDYDEEPDVHCRNCDGLLRHIERQKAKRVELENRMVELEAEVERVIATLLDALTMHDIRVETTPLCEHLRSTVGITIHAYEVRGKRIAELEEAITLALEYPLTEVMRQTAHRQLYNAVHKDKPLCSRCLYRHTGECREGATLIEEARR